MNRCKRNIHVSIPASFRRTYTVTSGPISHGFSNSSDVEGANDSVVGNNAFGFNP
jgi:hypothetical protein